ncbi:MAG TPA: COX15/CtaA family protein [Planctomycetota bacterium]|nr:COX15/CtaA family protein [Planctomycetota bacterium]
MTIDGSSNSAGPWPYRLSVATAVVAVLLVAMGGTVTTLRAGMAESNWINPDGYFLWTYPLDRYLGDKNVFVEHTHRLLGSIVGLLAIATAIATWFKEKRPIARTIAWLAVLAVCVQGLLGGLRVLENSPELAFVHGALAQAVFALLTATCLVLSPRWVAAAPSACKSAGGLQRASSVGAALVFAQVTVGAWLRHSGSDLALAVHTLLALFVLAAVVISGRRLRTTAQHARDGGRDLSALLGIKRRLHMLIGVQVVLGACATFWIYEVSGGMQAPVSVGEAVFATAHVLVGALLLAQMVAAAMWSRRVVCSPARAESLAVPQGAR